MRKYLLLLLLVSGCVSHQAHFCKQEPCDTILIQAIDSSQSQLHCAIYSFTLDSVGDSMLAAQDRGVEVRVVVEKQQAGVQGAEYPRLKERLPIFLDNNSRLMHHKFCVIDGQIVITGSYNWSEQATKYNDENLMVIQDPAIAEQFEQEFERIWDKIS